MLKNFFTFLYFAIVAIVSVFIFISTNFIIASDESISNNFNRIIISKIGITIIIDLLAIGVLYVIYLALKKLMKLETENRHILKLLTVVFSIVSIISLIIFFLLISK